MTRLTPLDYVHILFYVVLMVIVILVGAHAISVLDGIEKRQQQSELHHQKMLAQATQSLKDHERAWQEHRDLLRRQP